MSLFGASSTPTFGASPFGQSSTPTFGASSSGFGAASTPGFGSSTPSTTFGAPSPFGQQQSAASGFGSSTPAFGASSSSGFGGATFGQSSGGFGGFGATQSTFGQSSSGFGGFGATQSTFGQSSSGFGGFGATQSSFGGFGASQSTFGQSSGGGFGQSSSGFGGFGATQSSFGQSQSSFGGTGLFGGGNSFAAPAAPVQASPTTKVRDLPQPMQEQLMSVERHLNDQRLKAAQLRNLARDMDERTRANESLTAKHNGALKRANATLDVLGRHLIALKNATLVERRDLDAVRTASEAHQNRWQGLSCHVPPSYFERIVSDMERRASEYRREIDEIGDFLKAQGVRFGAFPSANGGFGRAARMDAPKWLGEPMEDGARGVDAVIQRQYKYFMRVASQAARMHDEMLRLVAAFRDLHAARAPLDDDPFQRAEAQERAKGIRNRILAQQRVREQLSSRAGAAPTQGFGSSTPFGQSSASAFGSSTGGGLFGSTGASSTPGFGASSSSLFGGSSTPGFGASSASLFGGSSTPGFGASSASLFGGSSTPGFGASSSSLFGSSTPSSTFGAASTPSLFGGGGDSTTREAQRRKRM